jgi:DNA-binding XRE family transcriptional regulator
MELKTLGDHLRKTRLDRGLSQRIVASMLQVDTDTVTTWEMNRHQPTAKFAKSIIEFLGYFPFTLTGCSLGKKLYYVRLIRGKTQWQVAKLIGCDAATIRGIDLEQRKSFTRTSEKIQDYIDDAVFSTSW